MSKESNAKLTKALVSSEEKVSIFLGAEITDLRAGGGPAYNLEQEFAKTKRNRKPVIIFAVLIVTIIMGLAAWGATWLIDRKSKNVNINIEEFSDLNLRDLLDSVRRYNDELDKLTRNLVVLRRERDTKLSQALENRDMEKDLAVSYSSSTAERNRRLTAADKEYDSAVEEINNLYNPQIEDIELKIQALQEKIASYDTRSMEQAKKQQEILDNQRMLFELEKQKMEAVFSEQLQNMQAELEAEKQRSIEAREKLRADLTLLYNPLWSTRDRAGTLIAGAETTQQELSEIQWDDVALFPAYSTVSPEDYLRIKTLDDDTEYMLNTLRAIPWRNSMPSTFLWLQTSSKQYSLAYTNLVRASHESEGRLRSRLSDIIARQDSWGEALAMLLQTQDVPAVVTSIVSEKKIRVFLNPELSPDFNAGNLPAWVYDSEDKLVATIYLVKRGSDVWGTVQSIVPGQRIRSLDRVLLKIQDVSEVHP